MYVPYCSSDEHAGNRDASAETANLHFNGKNIVADVVDQLMAHPLAGQEIEKIVIIGFSAGGAGVARNCDFMADRLAALGSTAKVLFSRLVFTLAKWFLRLCASWTERTLSRTGWPTDAIWSWTSGRALSSGYDSDFNLLLDFCPKKFPQNAHEDDTCVSALGDTAVECSAFSTFWPYVETPFMIVSSEADPVVHFCADNPALGENTPGSFAREWRQYILGGGWVGYCHFRISDHWAILYTSRYKRKHSQDINQDRFESSSLWFVRPFLHSCDAFVANSAIPLANWCCAWINIDKWKRN